jgi:cob(I)alamin adenosyltransferase
MNKQGLVHIYTGDGKGKTSAALGLVMRSYGNDMKVLFCQFLKGQDTSELFTLNKLGISVLRTDEVKKFVPFMDENEKKNCKKSHDVCYNKMKHKMLSGEYDIVVLDEIIPATALGLVSLQDLIALLKQRPAHVEVILTGRDAPQELIEIADYVSEIRLVKHPYEKGIQARKGIEY